MSLARTAVRMTAVRAITGRTLAGDRVHDSAIVPIDVKITDDKLPMITVVTDDDVLDVKGRDLAGAERHLDLVIEIAVATKVTSDGGTVVFEIPETDFGLEWTLDVIEEQIDRALLGDDTVWSTIFIKLVTRIFDKTSKRAASVEKGRYAARQIVYSLDPVACPQWGDPVAYNSPYGLLLAAMAADAELAEYGTFLRSIMENGALEDWQRQARMLGLISVAGLGPEGLAEEATITGDIQDLVIIRGAHLSLNLNSTLIATATKVTP